MATEFTPSPHLAGALAGLARRIDLDARLAPYHRLIWDGRPPRGPVLHLEDVSAIPFLVGIAGVELYQHRARVRAGDGDLYCAVTPAAPGYEEYCRGLGLGAPELVVAEPAGNLLAVAQAAAAGEARARIARRAREAGRLTIHPYMGIEDAWVLAQVLAADASVPVTVIGPPPPVTWIANDKALFSEVVALTLGDGWLVETYTSDDPRELSRRLFELAGRHQAVGLKRTRCASAMGNAVWRSSVVRGGDRAALEVDVRRFLSRTEWPEGEEVLAVAWADASASPSTQLWIPPHGAGPPRLDGVYEQILAGEERVFVGSRPSGLPEPVNRALGDAAMAVAGSLQALGYAGRCSFDHLVLGDPEADFTLKFTECNGRWGGTSTPMHLVDRLFGAPRPPYRAQDVVRPELIGVSFPEILARVGADVYDPRSGRGRFVFYNVGPLAASGKLDVVSVGASRAEAEVGLEEVLPDLLARG